VAHEFIERLERENKALPTVTKARWVLGLLSAIEHRPVAGIEPYELLAILKPIEAGGRHETARRVRAFASRVFRYAIATTRARYNPASDLAGALVAPQVRHHAAILDGVALGGLLRAIEGFEGQPSTRLALRLAPHVFVRPGELRQAEWSEFDLEASVWRIPGGRTKMRREHVVPLSRQAVTILKEARLISAGSRYVFPGIGSSARPMSENTLNAALRRLSG
jgi:integrase